jgi:hypothetical protein
MPPATMDETRTLAERCRDALLDCFSPDDLRMLVSDRLDVKLAWVTPDRSFAIVVFELVEWARRNGKFCELLAAAAERVPGKPILAALRDECRAGGGRSPSPGAANLNLREAVVRFAERFKQRKRSVQLLEAYKSLHDVLHDLEGYQDTINRAVAAARGGPAGPDPVSVVDQLRDWAALARNWVDKTKTPARHRPWVLELDRSVEVVVEALTAASSQLAQTDPTTPKPEPPSPKPDPPVDVVNRAIERLSNLPGERQSGLNDLLIETLADFQLSDLQQPLADVLDAVRATGASAAFEERLKDFNDAVQAVADRSRDHDFCQKVSDVLIQAARLTVVTPDKLTDWAEVRGWLKQLADYRKNDQRAKRTAESATRFNQAAPADATRAFHTLEERFADLFYYTDKALLSETQDLVSAANALSAQLDGLK